MKLIILFIVTSFISFVGSIHPGPLNVSVIKKTLRKGLYKGLILAIGGVIPEIIYGYLAVAGLMIFKDYPQVFTIMNWLVVPILLLMGILSIRQKVTNEVESQSVSSRKGIASIELIEGFLYSILNPQLLPFWIVLLINYQNYPLLEVNDIFEKFTFVLAAATGAFALNGLYALIAHRKKEVIFKYLGENRFNIILGWTFIIMAIAQCVNLVVAAHPDL